ncbi:MULTISPECIES: Rpn family recombination-promoting nuclease/putative transposase [Cyanophyceae]|uniref:Rpn family recombination-promoting nuclease/putative transposase n=1 Tax=Cyanophyceae TaxID=3028117 RepID=UPI001F551BBD|nr:MULTISPECIES: Rpn family recombination-promoting nuclease/putative transposase [Cyanophyceae]
MPADCTFEYVAPVVKESEFRLDGLLLPLSDDLAVPVIFIEAQMQPDSRFYGRYFAETYYLYQYQVDRPWRGLLILQSRQQGLGSEAPYADLLEGNVQRIYLQDLLHAARNPAVSGPRPLAADCAAQCRDGPGGPKPAACCQTPGEGGVSADA